MVVREDDPSAGSPWLVEPVAAPTGSGRSPGPTIAHPK